MTAHRLGIVIIAASLACAAGPASAQSFGNWGGSSVAVGNSTMYANGLVSNRVGQMEYFNNGLVGRRYGNLTLYSNGLVAGQGRRNTYFSNLAVGVPVQSQAPGRPGITVYGGGYPYPLGPGVKPFDGPATRPAPLPGSANPATPHSTTPWSRTPWGR